VVTPTWESRLGVLRVQGVGDLEKAEEEPVVDFGGGGVFFCGEVFHRYRLGIAASAIGMQTAGTWQRKSSLNYNTNCCSIGFYRREKCADSRTRW
jgi:hypothetical protein